MRSASFPRRCLRSLALLLVLLAVAVAVLRWTGVPETLFYHPRAGETPVPARFEGGENVEFSSADGTRLRGWFLPAEGRIGRKAPAVLFVHGNAGDLHTHVGFADFLPAAGFHVLLFDYRGYGESGGAARRRDDLLADAHAALDALLARPEVDPDRVLVLGHSLGGAIGLNLLADRPEPRAGAFVSAFADWQDVAASVLGGDPPGLPARLLARALLPAHRRPLDAIARIDRPVLLLHGTADAVVPFSHGVRLAAAGPTAELVRMEHGDHNLWRSTQPEAVDRIVEFLRRQTGEER